MIEALRGLPAYEIIETSKVKELRSLSVLMRHKKTGAKLFLLSNDDENKVFYIGFKTPPKDSTGVAHILEHSVLCGSEKFPVKDPFVELVKGSLNTFLNAMTYPDKTVYPVASLNDTDFQNLMDVYMDAVFNPNIYREKKIFMQEGWHYELEDKDAPLAINGVVYNEMKGVFSSPESVLDRYTRTVLFPDNCYGNESGGDPDYIPDLSYEEFLNFHKTYYHPSNSYIYLYGNMDMAEKLTWLDREYLSKYDCQEVDSGILPQKPFSEPANREIFYSLSGGESEEDATYLSVNTVAGDGLDGKHYIAFQVLEYALLDAPGAALKQAMTDAGIGQDLLGGYENGILQPYFSVIAKNANKEQLGEFLAVVKGTLRKLADQGIDRKMLLAGINYYEFRYREADFGGAPKGLMYGLQSLDSWLYGGDPLTHLEYEKVFEELKKGVDEGYFESLLRDLLLDNPFEAVITVSPRKNLTAENEAALAKKLSEYKASLSEEQLAELVKQTRELKEYQEIPSPKEDLLKIPLLSRGDISREAEAPVWEEKGVDGVKVIHHDLPTSGIGYLKLLFDTDRVAVEDLPYVGLLKAILGLVNTENYSYSDLSSEINLNSGGISFNVTSYVDLAKEGAFKGYFVANAKVLYDKIDFGFSMIGEMLNHSILTDEKRLREVLAETKSRSQMKLNQGSHSAAVARATSYFSGSSYFNDMTGGIGFYQFLEQAVKEAETDCASLIGRLKRAAEALFAADNLLVSYTADQDGFEKMKPALARFAKSLRAQGGVPRKFEFPAGNRNEGFMTSSQVNYVARCGSFLPAGLSYHGALKILKVILSYDYLWIQVRVKGGAYGVMSGIGRSGEGYFVSYRDPNLRETNTVYENIVEYLENFDADERDMTKYVIGTISDLDAPLTPSLKGSRGLSAYLSGVTAGMLAEEREQVLDATPADIRALAPIVKAVLDTGSLCVIGNEDKVRAESGLFGEVKNLFNN